MWKKLTLLISILLVLCLANSAWAIAICDLLSLVMMAADITGWGTNMEIIVTFVPGEVKVSPEEHSIPNSAPMYPDFRASTSSI